MFDFHALKNPAKQSVCVLAACGLLTGCVSVEKTTQAKYPPTNPGSVEFLQVTPYQPYQKIGTVEASGFGDDDWNDMRDSIREKSAEAGADAVIVNGEGYKDTMWGKGRLWEQGDLIRYNSSSPAIAEQAN